ncbi:MAG: tRNA (adenosine(37)-N6)-threonylcarbamoyltransferase complex ATPase subunit type 1 TsaE [Candidatus Wildermuthbacteria bacterium]|nr:tRNA (adenosine(37)-N6)-threonylcarbamoyltransferase complex ATPase subunit type 1 TsaE [Candidatus Wildermuthbacteria bacterium]
MGKSISSHSITHTKRIAQKIAERCAAQKPGKRAMVIALEGDLGAGKTAFAQGFAKGLGIAEKVLSPTFVIIKSYKIPLYAGQGKHATLPRWSGQAGYKLLYHLDCYRLKSGEDLVSLGWQEILNNPQAIIMLEWADRVKSVLPPRAYWARFSHSREERNARTLALRFPAVFLRDIS